MAKRYIPYSEIPAGHFKPGGTLGRHHAVVTIADDRKVVAGYDGRQVVVRPGDTLGYDCGSVWRVPPAESYRDPVRRVLAEAKLPQRILTETAEALLLRQGFGWSYVDAPSVDTSHGEFVRASLGQTTQEDVREEEEPLPDPRPSRKPMVPGRSFERRVTGGDAIIVESPYGDTITFRRSRRVVRVVVRPGVDRKVVAAWLRKELELEPPNS